MSFRPINTSSQPPLLRDFAPDDHDRAGEPPAGTVTEVPGLGALTGCSLSIPASTVTENLEEDADIFLSCLESSFESEDIFQDCVGSDEESDFFYEVASSESSEKRLDFLLERQAFQTQHAANPQQASTEAMEAATREFEQFQQETAQNRSAKPDRGAQPDGAAVRALLLEDIQQQWISNDAGKLEPVAVQLQRLLSEGPSAGSPQERESAESALRQQQDSLVDHLSTGGGAGKLDPASALSRQNFDKAHVLAGEIRREMFKLNSQLIELTGEPVSSKQEGQLETEELALSNWDHMTRWWNTAVGGLAALPTTLAQLGVAAALPGVAAPVAAMAGGGVTGASVQATAWMGSAYLGLTALRDYPSLANNAAAQRMISQTMASVQPKMQRLDHLIEDEKVRRTQGVRTLMVADARASRISALQAELARVDDALQVAPAGPGGEPGTRHTVSPAGGEARTQSLGVLAQMRESFGALFSSVSQGLGSAFRSIVGLPSLVSGWFERRGAAHAEQVQAQSLSGMLMALSATTDDSLDMKGMDVRAKERAHAGGGIMDLDATRKQIRMGDNLVRALMAIEDRTHSVLAFDGGVVHGKWAVAASLTTARAIAWYLDTIAVSADDKAKPGTPTVMRNPDGSLSVSDPERRIYSFLMGVPVAYTATMAGQESSEPAVAFMIDDHHRGMPAGMHGLQFETTLDDDGNAQLHLTFTPERSSPVFTPLANEKQLMLNMYEAQYAASAPRKDLGQDLTGWTQAQLHAYESQLVHDLRRESALFEADNAQFQSINHWSNPAFFQNRA